MSFSRCKSLIVYRGFQVLLFQVLLFQKSYVSTFDRLHSPSSGTHFVQTQLLSHATIRSLILFPNSFFIVAFRFRRLIITAYLRSSETTCLLVVFSSFHHTMPETTQILLAGLLDRDQSPNHICTRCCPFTVYLHYNGCSHVTAFMGLAPWIPLFVFAYLGFANRSFFVFCGSLYFFVCSQVILRFVPLDIDPDYLLTQQPGSENPCCGPGIFDRNRHPACFWRMCPCTHVQYKGSSSCSSLHLLSLTLFWIYLSCWFFIWKIQDGMFYERNDASHQFTQIVMDILWLVCIFCAISFFRGTVWDAKLIDNSVVGPPVVASFSDAEEDEEDDD